MCEIASEPRSVSRCDKCTLEFSSVKSTPITYSLLDYIFIILWSIPDWSIPSLTSFYTLHKVWWNNIWWNRIKQKGYIILGYNIKVILITSSEGHLLALHILEVLILITSSITHVHDSYKPVTLISPCSLVESVFIHSCSYMISHATSYILVY